MDILRHPENRQNCKCKNLTKSSLSEDHSSHQACDGTRRREENNCNLNRTTTTEHTSSHQGLAAMLDLPAEIWTQIFDLAADEHILFREGIPTSMAEFAWYKDVFKNQWQLRSPQQALNILHVRSYATKKAIMMTCRRWRDLGAEFLFRCLFFTDPFKMLALARILEAAPQGPTPLGWWTKRIHLVNFHHSTERKASLQDMETALLTIIRHCPNLQIFIAEKPLKSAFGPVVNALGRHAKKIHTVRWTSPGESLGKVIWALAALPRVVAAYIDIDAPVSASQEYAHLGSATNLRLRLPNLQQLSLRGYVAEFVEQCTGWELPRLHGLTVDSGNSVNESPDVLELLRAHGNGLRFLDLNLDTGMPINVAASLELAPNLWTFAFNGDWRIDAGELVRHPHTHITSIGVHGLTRAFTKGPGPGTGVARHEWLTVMGVNRMQTSNDLNIAALNRRNFPRLRQVRALSHTMLQTLNDMNGPSTEDGGYERWNKWWNHFTAMGVRLEDCTGSVLGTLPMDEADEEESSSEEEDEDEEIAEEEVEEEEEEQGQEEDGDVSISGNEEVRPPEQATAQLVTMSDPKAAEPSRGEGGVDGEEEEDSEDEDEDDSDSFEEEPVFRMSQHLSTPQLAEVLQEVRLMNLARDEAMIAKHRPNLPPSRPSSPGPLSRYM